MNIPDLATWLGAGIALVSAGFSFWYPWYTRVRARWFIQQSYWSQDVARVHKLEYFSTHSGRSDPDLVLEIFNDGDGAAYNVMIDVEGGEGCIFHIESLSDDFDKAAELPNVPMVNPQESFTVALWCDDPDLVVLKVEWTVQPTHLQKRVYYQYALVGEIEPQPRYPIPLKRERRPWLWWYRLTHWLRGVLKKG